MLKEPPQGGSLFYVIRMKKSPPAPRWPCAPEAGGKTKAERKADVGVTGGVGTILKS
jgi:hypothetical protein